MQQLDFSKQLLWLAPLAGVTDTVFRSLCRRHGADVVVSEMVSVEGISYKSKKTAGLLAFDPQERPLGVQLFGNKPESFARASAFVCERVSPDFLDLNSGCPVAKVSNKNGGAGLLRDRHLFEQIVTQMVKNASCPVTVKLRSGWFEHEWVDEEFAKTAEGAGASAIILHPRSRSMIFSGHAYWTRIALVKRCVSIPVIGNGDVVSGSDALRMVSDTGCNGVMIGRGALGSPWIFKQCKAALSGAPIETPNRAERLAFIREHFAGVVALYGEKKAATLLRRHCAWYLRSMPGAAEFRNRIFKTWNMEEIDAVMAEAFAEAAN